MSEMGKIRALITAVGTVNGSAVVEELRKNGKSVHIIGANSTPASYVVNSKFVDEYYEFPSAVSNRVEYLQYVLEFCKQHNITHLFCFIDEEVESFSKNKKMFENIGVKLCIADYHTIGICHFKDKFSRWIRDNIPQIWIEEYTVFNNPGSFDFPIFAKPIEGRASIGCRQINDDRELMKFLEANNNGTGYILQKFTSGEVVGVDIVRNRKYNQLIMIQKKELMRNSNGCGTVVEIIDNPVLTEICSKIAEKLDLNGIVNAEFFMTEDGPKIIEINPRLPAGTSYSCKAGGNIVMNALLISENHPCEYDEIKIGTIFARRYETYEM